MTPAPALSPGPPPVLPFAPPQLAPPVTRRTAAALLSLRFEENRVAEKLAAIHRAVLHRSSTLTQANYTAISAADLRLLFLLYDQQFFSGLVSRHVKDCLSFSLSPRMTRSAGKTVFRRAPTRFEIRLSRLLLFGAFADVPRQIEVNGVLCQDRLEATMRVFEHELVHLLEFMLFSTSTCTGPTFQRLSWNLFRHIRQTHRLVTPRERAAAIMDLHIGSEVSFEVRGRQLAGTVYRITKRATVMVPDCTGLYVDPRGQHYAKYYVPLERLQVRRQAGKSRSG